MSKLEVGQKVWVVSTDYRGNAQPIEETTVKSVGRKYFTVNGNFSHEKFHLESGRVVTNYTPKTTVYTDINIYLDGVERSRLGREVAIVFGGYSAPSKITTDQLRRIKSIIDEPKQ